MSELRQYSVHPSHDGATHRVEGCSFEEAAFAFIDRWHPTPDAEGDVDLVVVDQESGRQQCFRIDLSTGDAAPCT